MFDETNNTEERGFDFSEKPFESDASETNENFEGDNIIADSEPMGETLRIKYNGEERDISLDEARILAQKGLNYDHVLAERDTRYQRELNALDAVAARQGMTRAQYIASVENSLPQNNAEDYDSIRTAASLRAKEQIKRLEESVGLSGPWGNLFRKYPELSRKEAYSDLSDDVRSGMSPLEAYQTRLLAQKEKELQIAKNNGAAANRSVGSLEGDGQGEKLDDFLVGFYSVRDY